MERNRRPISRNTKTKNGIIKKKRISTSSAKAKGRNLQQWVCKQISELLDIPWGQDEMIASREMGQAGTDVRLIGEAKKKFPYSVECKCQETWSFPSWIIQARKNQAEGTDWLLIVNKNYHAPTVTMDAVKFFELLEKVKK